MYRGSIARFSLAFGLIAVCAIAATSCKKESQETSKPAPVADTRYTDWKTFNLQNIRIIYPPGHPLESTFTTVAEGYLRSIKRVDEILGMGPFTDTLKVYYYSGYGQGRELTGQQYPFADSQGIHFWLPSFYGPTLTQFLLPRWAPDPPRHKFLKHGLIALFDFSGQNYHASTIGYVNSHEFIPLEKLATDTAVNSNEERFQSAEAASFCAYMLADFGPQALRDLYVSPVSLDSSLKQTCFAPVDTIQMRWLAFVKLNVPKDSIRDSIGK